MSALSRNAWEAQNSAPDKEFGVDVGAFAQLARRSAAALCGVGRAAPQDVLSPQNKQHCTSNTTYNPKVVRPLTGSRIAASAAQQQQQQTAPAAAAAAAAAPSAPSTLAPAQAAAQAAAARSGQRPGRAQEVVRAFYDAYNRRDLAAISELIADDISYQ